MTQTARRPWLDDEIEFIKDYFNEMSCGEMAQALERSHSSVTTKACRLGLSFPGGREQALANRKLAKRRLAFLRDPCMITASSKVGEYWSTHAH